MFVDHGIQLTLPAFVNNSTIHPASMPVLLKMSNQILISEGTICSIPLVEDSPTACRLCLLESQISNPHDKAINEHFFNTKSFLTFNRGNTLITNYLENI